ncbi:MAG: MerR family transcriptional regulator [Myxococcota bacterium]
MTAAASIRERFPYRMKDLCEATDLPRQAIHFYIQQGLLPAGHKTGRNMAWYGEEHIERLRLIRKLQHERFLPLKAIKAMLDGREEEFSEEQESFLLALKRELRTSVARGVDFRRAVVDVSDRLEELQITREELIEMAEVGVLGVDANEGLRIAEDDLWILEFVRDMRDAGFTKEAGFGVAELRIYVEALDTIVRREAILLSNNLSSESPIAVARMIERTLPLIQNFLTRYHASRVRDLFSAM